MYKANVKFHILQPFLEFSWILNKILLSRFLIYVKDVFTTMSEIYDGGFLRKCIFNPSYMFDRVLNTPLHDT